MLIRTNVTNIGDPFILRQGDEYYMYATGFDVNGYKVRKSKNLHDWEELGVCLDLNDSWAHQDFWAPEVIYHNGKYVMHYSARRKSDESLRIGVAVADKPEGPFKDVHGGPMFDLGYAVIDAHVFIDDDGTPYFYFSKDCSENVINGIHTSQICVCKCNDDLTEIITKPQVLFGSIYEYEGGVDQEWCWNEGPYVLKKDGKYYMTYSANFYASKEYCICLAISDRPDGGFVKIENNPILTYKDKAEDFSGPGHNAFFTDTQGKLKMTFHIHTDPSEPSQNRKACICDAEIKEKTILFDLEDEKI